MGIVWRRGKANINRLFGNAPLETHIARGTACHLPYEILETIITHIARDLNTLKACSLTCHSVLFEACAETLEMLRLYATDPSVGGYFSMGLSTNSS